MGDGTRVLLISDFNIANLAGYLKNQPDAPGLLPVVAPFGQVTPILLDPDHEVFGEPSEVAIVWTQPQGVIDSFRAVLDFDAPPLETILAEVDHFADQLARLAERTSTVLVPSWLTPTSLGGLGPIDLGSDGVARILAEMNLQLARRLDAIPEVFLLNAQKWIERVGPGAFSSKFWYMGKIPFSQAVFKTAAGDIGAALASLAGKSRKLIVLDLDDTLWGGIVGDVGWESLKLGGHDAIGEAFADFQSALRALRQRGILLALASKNEESVALEAIEKNPEMVLSRDDFVAWRINWNDKAGNIEEMVAELNLGLQSVVFIDDNPAERARVAETLPEILVPDWPKEKMLYREALQSMRCFDVVSVGDEDRRRTDMYAQESQRQRTQASAASLDQWLTSLELVVEVEGLNASNTTRVVQLLNKTNQMNLTTRRLNQGELLTWLEEEGRKLWAIRVADRFGDSGLTGIVSIECRGEEARIVDFVLSCRVFGREVERVMVHVAAEYARQAGMKIVSAHYLATPKNAATLRFWQGSGFSEADQVFRWELDAEWTIPDFIQHVGNG